MFAVGDLIIYSQMGVCRVAELTRPSFASTQLHYVLEPLYQRGRIYVPADAGVFMRPILCAEAVDKLIDAIPAMQADAYYNPVLRLLSEHYESVLGSHACEDLLQLAKSIYNKKQDAAQRNRQIGQVDERYQKRAEDMLYGEFAAALGIAREEVPAYIAARIDKIQKG